MKITQVLSTGILAAVVAAAAVTAPTSPLRTDDAQNLTAASVALVTDQMDRPTVRSSSLLRQESTDPNGEGATVIKGFPCGIPVPGIGQVATTNSHSVVTPSGNAALSCHASTPIVVPQTLVFTDLPCGTLGPAGTDSHLVVTDTGRVNFWCHHHK